MTLRSDHILDLEARLNAAVNAAVGGPLSDLKRGTTIHVHRGRVTALDQETGLPALCIYGLGERSSPSPSVSMSSSSLTHDLAIEVRVAKETGADMAALLLAEAVIDLLLRDPDWLARWKSPPTHTSQLFLDSKTDEEYAGEAIGFTCEDLLQHHREVVPPTDELLGVDIDVQHTDGTLLATMVVGAPPA